MPLLRSVFQIAKNSFASGSATRAASSSVTRWLKSATVPDLCSGDLDPTVLPQFVLQQIVDVTNSPRLLHSVDVVVEREKTLSCAEVGDRTPHAGRERATSASMDLAPPPSSCQIACVTALSPVHTNGTKGSRRTARQSGVPDCPHPQIANLQAMQSNAQCRPLTEQWHGRLSRSKSGVRV